MPLAKWPSRRGKVPGSGEISTGLLITRLKQTYRQVCPQDHRNAMKNQKRWVGNPSL